MRNQISTIVPEHVIYQDVIDIQKFFDIRNRQIAQNDPVIKIERD